MITKIKQQIIDEVFKIDKGARLIYLFGSYAQGLQNEQSDIDIAVLFSIKKTKKEIFDMSQNLAVTLNSDIDLISLNEADTDIKIQIIKKGILLFENEKDFHLGFEMRLLKEYQMLNEERSVVLESKFGDKIWKQ